MRNQGDWNQGRKNKYKEKEMYLKNITTWGLIGRER